MVGANRSQNYAREQKYDIEQFAKFVTGDRTKSDVFKGKHFNIVVICLDDGYEIPPHDEPYDVFFYIVSGRGIFTAGTRRWDASPGSMIFAPAGARGIKCLSRLTILGIQEPH
ncbi:MAG: cupin domain-containing protein [Dehalococcoidia bacterium]